jgi:hypothetical protein
MNLLHDRKNILKFVVIFLKSSTLPRSKYVPVERNFVVVARFRRDEKSITCVFSADPDIPIPLPVQFSHHGAAYSVNLNGGFVVSGW